LEERQAMVTARAQGNPMTAAQAHYQVAHPNDVASYYSAFPPVQRTYQTTQQEPNEGGYEGVGDGRYGRHYGHGGYAPRPRNSQTTYSESYQPPQSQFYDQQARSMAMMDAQQPHGSPQRYTTSSGY
jgi:hypothetical protein